MKLLKKWFKKLQTNMGYTLVEVAAVVAITATLGAVVVPVAVDKVNEGKVTAARADTQSIGNAVGAFLKDTGQWPASDSTGTLTFYHVLRSGKNASADLGSAANDPRQSATLWSQATPARTDHLNNHVVQDNPGGTIDSTTPNRIYLNTLKLNWKGPYSEDFKKSDPWGNNFLVYVKAMHTASTGVSKEYGWIISAGPNAILETKVTDPTLKGDDIGYALFSAETGH